MQTNLERERSDAEKMSSMVSRLNTHDHHFETIIKALDLDNQREHADIRDSAKLAEKIATVEKFISEHTKIVDRWPGTAKRIEP
tara:strand:+ start:433 stop:684 length:252 start_codon:yes stop_codon:yes gene_type:complete